MYSIRDASGQFVARARSKATAHRASRRKNMAGSSVARSSRKKEVERFGHEVRLQLRQLGVRQGYVAFASIGPYDHNPTDYPLPLPDMPLVFRALYEAVEYAQKMKGLDKVKIELVDGSALPGTHALSGDVVWRSWQPGTHGGWSTSNAAGAGRRRRNRAEGDESVHDYHPTHAQFMESDHDYHPAHAPTLLSDDEADAQAEIDAMAAASPEGPEVEVDDAGDAMMTVYERPETAMSPYEPEATFEEPRRAEYHVSVTRLS